VTWWEAALVLLAGVGAGTINTIVGSGTLITFPTLLALGLPPVTANVSNCIGLAIGGSSGVWGYRRELSGLGGLARTLVPLSVAGATGGALLLLVLPAEVFEAVVPVLIAAALVLVILQPRIARALRRDETGRSGEADPGPEAPVKLSRRRTVALRSGVAATGVYGGYFGAAQGVLLVGVLGTLLPISLQPVNALKNVLGTCANGAAAVTFVLVAPDQIDWAVVVLIMIGSLAGGLIGAHIGRRLRPSVLRAVIVVVGLIALVRLVTA
jgi:uncharacterized membrane protein YfcA